MEKRDLISNLVLVYENHGKVSNRDAELILKSFGRGAECAQYYGPGEITAESMKSKIHSFKQTCAVDQDRYLFDLYSEDGKINRENLREMFLNHMIDLHTLDEIEDLLDIYFRKKDKIDFKEFKSVSIF
jgi:hypothetical protein